MPREDNKDKALADPAKPCSPRLSPHRVHKASPNKARPDTRIARRGSQPGKPAESLTIMTCNVMGLTTVMHELKQLILSHSPDVVVITETKLNKKNCNSRVIKDIFEDYTLLHSCNAPVDPLRREANPGSLDRNGAGGVTVAIKDLWCSSGSAKLIPNNGQFLGSHCVCVDLHPPHSDPLLICGTYMPFDRAQRNNIHAHLQEVMQTYQHTVLAGDWNAALYTTDRSLQEDAELIDNPSRMALDNMHEGFVRDTSLHPIDPVNECLGECRARTFRSNRADANGSRIDDVLTSTALRDSSNYLQFPDCNGDSDHNPIVAAITTKSLTLIPPAPALPDQPKSPRFKTPMKVEELTKFREVLSLTAGQKINAIALALTSLRQTADQTCKDDREIPSKVKLAPFNTQLQQIEEDLANLMSTTILPIAKENLSMTSPTTQTQKHHRPRGLQRKIVKRARTARWLRKAVCT